MTRISAEGLVDFGEFIRTAPEVATRAASMAINDVATRSGLRAIKDKMTDEIDFPSGYLSGDRLKVTQRATPENLLAVITGRKRSTSLARFSSGTAVPNSKAAGVNVRVQQGRTTFLKKAFLVRLKKGASLTEDNYNIGLAIRVGPGETVLNKKTVHKSWLVPGKVALLYGPSVDQIFASVADDLAPELAEMTANEFFRQFARLTNV